MTESELEKAFDVLRVIQRHVGEKNAVRSEQIEAALGVPGTFIRAVVHAAVRRGVRLSSGPNGYWYPTREEQSEYLERERRRMLSIAAKVSGAKKNMANELTLFEQDSPTAEAQ